MIQYTVTVHNILDFCELINVLIMYRNLCTFMTVLAFTVRTQSDPPTPKGAGQALCCLFTVRAVARTTSWGVASEADSSRRSAPRTIKNDDRDPPLLFERKRELFTVRRVSAVGGTMKTTASVPALAIQSSRDGTACGLSNNKNNGGVLDALRFKQ